MGKPNTNNQPINPATEPIAPTVEFSTTRTPTAKGGKGGGIIFQHVIDNPNGLTAKEAMKLIGTTSGKVARDQLRSAQVQAVLNGGEAFSVPDGTDIYFCLSSKEKADKLLESLRSKGFGLKQKQHGDLQAAYELRQNK